MYKIIKYIIVKCLEKNVVTSNTVSIILLPIMKLYIPSFEQKIAVKDLLNFVKFLLQTIWVDCFQFYNPSFQVL